MSGKIRCEMRFPEIRIIMDKTRTLQLDRLPDLRHHEEYKIYYKSQSQMKIRLMEIEMTDISTEISRITQPNLQLNRFSMKPYLSIHICSIHIYLSSISMNNITNLSDSLFKYAKRTWIRNHNRS